MEVYALKVKSNKNVNVFVVETNIGDYQIHSDCIVKYGIKKGKVQDELFFEAIEESDRIVAFNLIAKYLSASMKTEKQIKDYLYKKGYETKTIKSVIEKLKDYNLIDDKAFAENYININPTFSANKLKQKLYSFGVNKQIVDNLLCDFDDLEGCETSANKFLKNKPNDQKTKEKLIRHLINKGYNWGAIGKVVQDCDFNAEVCE